MRKDVEQPTKIVGKAVAGLSDEDRLRAEFYAFLAAFLSRPPTAERLQATAALQGDDTPIGQGVATLARLAQATTPAAVEREYNALFIGLGRGELVPYASYYMTGFLNEKPLAKLRRDMAEFGVKRAEDVFEPEDNIASLCDMMAGLIRGDFGASADRDQQRDFFATHLGPWAGHFFTDLEGAENSVFYAPIGAVGRAFIEVEREAFRMEGQAA